MMKTIATRAAVITQIFSAALIVSACGGGVSSAATAPLQTQVAAIAAKASSPLAVIDAKYGAHDLQSVTLQEPAALESKGLVVWIHGGGWFMGDKVGQDVLFVQLVAQGYAVLNIDYRLNADGAFPGSVNDTEAVLQAVDEAGCRTCTNPDLWARANFYAKTAGIQIAGTSAGAYLAVQGAGQYVSTHPTTLLRCVNSVSGVSDVRDYASYGDFSKQMISAYASGDISLAKLDEMSPSYLLEQRRWLNLSHIKWAFSMATEDEFVPVASVLPIKKLLVDQGARVNFFSGPGDSSSRHHVTDDWARKFIIQEAQNCFTAS